MKPLLSSLLVLVRMEGNVVISRNHNLIRVRQSLHVGPKSVYVLQASHFCKIASVNVDIAIRDRLCSFMFFIKKKKSCMLVFAFIVHVDKRFAVTDLHNFHRHTLTPLDYGYRSDKLCELH